jgi:hypothetical protein
MPEVHFTLFDFLRYLFFGVMADFAMAIQDKQFVAKVGEIIMFRFNHYWGSYRGNHALRRLSDERKNNYFYPKDLERKNYENRCVTPNKSQQRARQGQEFS